MANFLICLPTIWGGWLTNLTIPNRDFRPGSLLGLDRATLFPLRREPAMPRYFEVVATAYSRFGNPIAKEPGVAYAERWRCVS